MEGVFIVSLLWLNDLSATGLGLGAQGSVSGLDYG